MADEAQATWRAFTIQGPQVALAMLRGSKRIESRKRRMAAGWYYLHVGRQSINSLPPECSAALRQTWPDAPEEASLSKSCVVGMVCLGKVIQASKVENPWVCASLPLVPEIVAIEFRSPVRWEKGKQAVWHVKEGEMQGKLKEATASGIPCGQLQKMRDPLPSARSSRSRLGKARSGSAVLTLGTPAVRLKFPSQHPSVAGCFFAALCKSRSWQKHQHQKPCRPAQARRGDRTVAVLPNGWQQEGRWSC